MILDSSDKFAVFRILHCGRKAPSALTMSSRKQQEAEEEFREQVAIGARILAKMRSTSSSPRLYNSQIAANEQLGKCRKYGIMYMNASVRNIASLAWGGHDVLISVWCMK